MELPERSEFPRRRQANLPLGEKLSAMKNLGYATIMWLAGSAPGWSQEPVWLETLDLKAVVQGRGEAAANRSVAGKPLSIGGKRFVHGVGTNANSSFPIDLKGAATRFEAQVGVDDAVKPKGRVVFRVLVDGKQRYHSGIMRGGDAPRPVNVDLRGARRLELLVENQGGYIFQQMADWAQARIYAHQKPAGLVLAKAAAVRRTPPATPKPRLTGSAVAAARPGSPLLYTVHAAGSRPMHFEAEGLPPGLSLNPATGQITGKVDAPGNYTARVSVSNALGSQSRTLHIDIGEKLGLTPAMGWNSWNAWGSSVDDVKIRAAADQLVSSGLAGHGWNYINIDDGWTKSRDAAGNIVPNSKFPDMRSLSDYVHSKGLKFGIYSSPGPKTCAGFLGSYGHEAQDAATYAAWGVDYLKYDWCSCTSKDPQAPYKLMHRELRKQPRDIHFSLCQYGDAKVWTWGAAVGGQSWRTTGDIDDVWGSMSDIGFNQHFLAPFAGPGHFNDPDMLVVGWLGWGPQVRPTRLDPNEQYTHVTLWSLLAAPLLIGCDLTRLDDFTMGLLTNDEVIDVDQDIEGKQGWRLNRKGDTEVWGRPLADGSWAVGLFNRGLKPTTVTLDTSWLKLPGDLRARDLWRQKDLGRIGRAYTRVVAPHGAEMLKVQAQD